LEDGGQTIQVTYLVLIVDVGSVCEGLANLFFYVVSGGVVQPSILMNSKVCRLSGISDGEIENKIREEERTNPAPVTQGEKGDNSERRLMS
jgi:hypothetical protein